MQTATMEKVEGKERVHLSAAIAPETLRELRLFAVRTNRTLGAAVDFCIRDAIHAWKESFNVEEDK